VTNCGRSRPTS